MLREMAEWAGYTATGRLTGELMNETDALPPSGDELWIHPRMENVRGECDALRDQLKRADEEVDRLKQVIEDQNADGCGWKLVAEDALKLVREAMSTMDAWFNGYVFVPADNPETERTWLARARVTLGRTDSPHSKPKSASMSDKTERIPDSRLSEPYWLRSHRHG